MKTENKTKEIKISFESIKDSCKTIKDLIKLNDEVLRKWKP